MATSGVATFNMDFTEIAEEAWERAGRPLMSGYDLRTARRSMNLLMLEWQNRGINMFTIDEGQIILEEGVAAYDLPADTIDLLDAVIRTNPGSESLQSDLSITRISVMTYATIPNKLTQARPIQMWIQRGVAQPTVTVWPVPDQGSEESPYYVLRYWRMRRIENAGSGAETPDVNARFLPALVAGLAYQLSLKVPELMVRAPMLKAEYEESYQLAASEDRDKVPMRCVPRVR